MPPKPRKFTVPKLDAVPDTLDFRDRMFEPTLVEVPTEIPSPTIGSIRFRYSIRAAKEPAQVLVWPASRTIYCEGAR